jgi:hypothetical protein
MEQVSPRPRDRARASAHPSEASPGPWVPRRGKTWLITFVLVVVPLAWDVLLLWGVARLPLPKRAAAMGDPARNGGSFGILSTGDGPGQRLTPICG